MQGAGRTGYGSIMNDHFREPQTGFITSDTSKAPDIELKGCEVILLVEDDAALLHLIATSLTKHGYTVISARNPLELLSLYAKSSVSADLLLTNVVMPDISGSELARRVGEITPDVKVLFMTGCPRDRISNHGLMQNAGNFIEKPFSSTTALVRMIRTLLDPPGAERVKTTGRTDATSLKLLIIEDECAIAKMLKIFFGRKKIPVTVAKTAREAVDFLNSDEVFDAVILDLGLPDSSGLPLYEEIDRLCPQTPIIVSSGDHNPEIIARTEANPALRFYMMKPYDNNSVLSMLDAMLPASNTRSGLIPPSHPV